MDAVLGHVFTLKVFHTVFSNNNLIGKKGAVNSLMSLNSIKADLSHKDHQY